MARDLKLQVILDAVDKATGPLKKITRGSGKTAEALKASRDQLKSLEKAQKDLRAFRDMKRQAGETGQALKEERERISDLSNQIRRAEGDTSSLNKERDKAIRKAQELAKKYDQQRQGAQRLKTSLRDTHGITGKLAGSEQSLARQIRTANEEIDQQQQKLKKLADRQKRVQQAQRQYHRSIGRANNMTGAGFTGLATGGAALYGAGRMLAPGVEYGETMSRVQALTRLQGDDPHLAALRQQSRDLGSSTAFSASQVGQGQAFLAMAGFTPDAIRQAIPDMLNMALANDVDLGRTADISSNILSGFGLDPDQMGRVADVLTATTTRANVDLEMLGDSMKYVAPQARAMGLSLEQAASMTALLGNVGIQGSQAGTTLRAMMTRLAAPTGKAATALKNLGVQAKDSNGDLRSVPKILADVAKATENMGNADRAGYLKDIFGEEPGAGMAELIAQQGTAGIEKFVGILKGAEGESGRVAKTMADNIGGDLKGLKSAWDEVGISITDTNEGPLRDLIQMVTSITRAVGDWIKENPELAGSLAKTAAGLAALVAVGGAFTIMMAGILGPLVTTRFALEYLGLRAKGADSLLTKLAKGGFKAAGRAGGWLSGAFRTVSIHAYTLATRALPALGNALVGLGRGFVTLASAIGRAGLALMTNPITWIVLGIVAAVAALAGAAYLIYKNWGPISEWFGNLWGSIRAGVTTAWNAITSTIGNAWQAIKDHIAGQWQAFKALPGQLASIGGDIIDGLIGGLTAKMGALKDKITGIAGSVTGWFKDKLGIHSPSRVFAQLGGYTVDGLNVGLDAQRHEPAKRVAEIARNVQRAGAGMALGALALPAAASPGIDQGEPIRFDSRPPLSAGTGQQAVDQRITLGDINITAAPGMNEQQLAQYVAREVQRALENARHEQAARGRSSMWDQE